MSLHQRLCLKCLLPIVLVGVVFGGLAHGDLVYVFSGVGSGTLGGSPFDGAFTITAQGDETLVTNPLSGVYRLDGVRALLEIDGLGSAMFAVAPSLFVSQSSGANFPVVGISSQTQSGESLSIFSVGNVPSLSNYTLRTVFPSVDGRALSNEVPFATTQGVLQIANTTSASFRAVPEPSSLLLLTMTMLGGFGFRQRR